MNITLHIFCLSIYSVSISDFSYILVYANHVHNKQHLRTRKEAHMSRVVLSRFTYLENHINFGHSTCAKSSHPKNIAQHKPSPKYSIIPVDKHPQAEKKRAKRNGLSRDSNFEIVSSNSSSEINRLTYPGACHIRRL